MMNEDDLREHWRNAGMPHAPKLNNKYTIRFSIGQTNTTEKHVLNAWKFILKKTVELERTGAK